jgi:hypothetical protein
VKGGKGGWRTQISRHVNEEIECLRLEGDAGAGLSFRERRTQSGSAGVPLTARDDGLLFSSFSGWGLRKGFVHTLDAFIFCNRMKMERRCERSARK